MIVRLYLESTYKLPSEVPTDEIYIYIYIYTQKLAMFKNLTYFAIYEEPMKMIIDRWFPNGA